MGGIALRGTPVTNTAAATTSLTINVPTGVQAGDLMLAYLCTDSTHPISTFTGWTAVDSQVWGGSPVFTGIVFKRTATSSEPASYTASNGGNSNWVGIVLAYSGAETLKGVSAQDTFATSTPGFGAGSSCSTGSMTPTQDGDLILNFVGTQKASTQIATFTPPSGYADVQTLVGSTMSIEISSTTQLAHGATGTQTTNFSAAAVTGAVTGLAVFARYTPIGGRLNIPHTVRAWEPPFVLRPRYSVATDSTPANIFPAPTLTGTAHLGTPTLRIDGTTSPLGQLATAVLGTPMIWNLQTATAQGVVGTPTFTNDMIFPLGIGLFLLRPLVTFVRSPAISTGSSPTAASLLATAALGTVVYQSSISASGLAASSALGTIAMRTDASLTPLGRQALATLGAVTYRNAYNLSGVAAASQVGVARASNNIYPTEPSVSAGAVVGSVGFAITSGASPTGVTAAAAVGQILLQFDNRFVPAGVAAAGQVGSGSGYGSLAGVQGSAQVGSALVQTNITMTASGVQGAGAVGVPTFAFDNRATVTGIVGTTAVGVIGIQAFTQDNTGEPLYTRTENTGVWVTQ